MSIWVLKKKSFLFLQRRIIDMHCHSLRETVFYDKDCRNILSKRSRKLHFQMYPRRSVRTVMSKTICFLERLNIKRPEKSGFLYSQFARKNKKREGVTFKSTHFDKSLKKKIIYWFLTANIIFVKKQKKKL